MCEDWEKSRGLAAEGGPSGASASGAVVQALRALGRLLLAEPEADLANFRAAFLATLGHDAGLITALLPEFETLLGSIEKPAI
jgi:hypothetical protein